MDAAVNIVMVGRSQQSLKTSRMVMTLPFMKNIKIITIVHKDKRGRIGIPLICLSLPHSCACPKPGPGFPMSYVMVFFVSSVKVRGDSLFC